MFDKLKSNKNKKHTKRAKNYSVLYSILFKSKGNRGKMNQSVLYIKCFLIKSMNINKIILKTITALAVNEIQLYLLSGKRWHTRFLSPNARNNTRIRTVKESTVLRLAHYF